MILFTVKEKLAADYVLGFIFMPLVLLVMVTLRSGNTLTSKNRTSGAITTSSQKKTALKPAGFGGRGSVAPPWRWTGCGGSDVALPALLILFVVQWLWTLDDGCIKLLEDSVFHFKFLQKSEEEQSLLGSFGDEVWVNIPFEWISCVPRNWNDHDGSGFTWDMYGPCEWGLKSVMSYWLCWTGGCCTKWSQNRTDSRDKTTRIK